MPELLAYPLRYMIVELERAIVADVVAAAPDSGLFKALGTIGLGLQKNADDQAYVIGPVDFDQAGLPPNVHVVRQPYVAVAKAFDKSTTTFNVYLIAMHADGYVEDPDGNRAMRASVQIQAVSDNKSVANRYLRTVDFCVTSTADGALTLAVRPGAEG